jgi:hypothetical protein
MFWYKVRLIGSPQLGRRAIGIVNTSHILAHAGMLGGSCADASPCLNHSTYPSLHGVSITAECSESLVLSWSSASQESKTRVQGDWATRA